MKLLQIITSLSTGGAEKLVVETTQIYQEIGIETDVVALKNTRTDFWNILSNKSKGKIIGLTSFSVYSPLIIFKIIPYLKKYDVVHVHLFPTLYWVVIAKYISFSKIKVVYTEHSTDNRRRYNIMFKILDRIVYKLVNEIVSISSKVEENLKKHLNTKTSERFSKISNGIDISVYANASAYKKSEFFSDDSFILIQVSSFRQPKDQKTIIKSLQYLPENIKLLLVGDGPLKKQHVDFVINLGLQHRVKFLGLRFDIPELLQTADVVVLSSYHEGLSLSSIEGMACKPFVASDVPGLTEVVSNYGLLFERGNAKQLAENILALYNDEDYYKLIADKCFERAKEFDIKKMIEGYIRLYNGNQTSVNH